MTLPEKLKIGGRTYQVIFPFKFVDTPVPLVGLHCPNGQTIKISGTDVCGDKINREAVMITFLHEIIHAIDHVYCNSRVGQTQNSEEIIDQLAEGIFQVFRDNDLWRLKCGK